MYVRLGTCTCFLPPQMGDPHIIRTSVPAAHVCFWVRPPVHTPASQREGRRERLCGVLSTAAVPRWTWAGRADGDGVRLFGSLRTKGMSGLCFFMAVMMGALHGGEACWSSTSIADSFPCRILLPMSLSWGIYLLLGFSCAFGGVYCLLSVFFPGYWYCNRVNGEYVARFFVNL